MIHIIFTLSWSFTLTLKLCPLMNYATLLCFSFYFFLNISLLFCDLLSPSDWEVWTMFKTQLFSCRSSLWSPNLSSFICFDGCFLDESLSCLPLTSLSFRLTFPPAWETYVIWINVVTWNSTCLKWNSSFSLGQYPFPPTDFLFLGLAPFFFLVS